MSEGVRVAVGRRLPRTLDGKLAGYLAATGAIGAGFAHQSQAAVVSNTTVQPFGINGEVNIDFNTDGQTDFQIDHDRVNLNGTDLDYLQLDKNDANGQNDPLPIDALAVFPTNGQPRNNDHKYLTDGGELGIDGGEYVAALDLNVEIGPASMGVWEFQESDDYAGDGTPPAFVRRANRLIDEDHGQIDGALAPADPEPSPPPGTARFVGLNGATKYVGVAIDLQDAGFSGNDLPTVNGPDNVDDPLNYWYGWIGIRISNEADATGEVIGYGYETQKGMPILAGDVGTPISVPGDYNGNNVVDAADYTIWRDGGPLLNEGASPGVIDEEDYNFWKSHFGDVPGSGALAGGAAVPEPASCVMAAIGGGVLLSRFVLRKLFRRD